MFIQASFQSGTKKQDILAAIGCKRTYAACTIIRLLQQYNAKKVHLCQRGGNDRLGQPPQGEIFYIQSTGGKWGRSSEIRIAPDLVEEYFKQV